MDCRTQSLYLNLDQGNTWVGHSNSIVNNDNDVDDLKRCRYDFGQSTYTAAQNRQVVLINTSALDLGRVDSAFIFELFSHCSVDQLRGEESQFKKKTLSKVPKVPHVKS